MIGYVKARIGTAVSKFFGRFHSILFRFIPVFRGKCEELFDGNVFQRFPPFNKELTLRLSAQCVHSKSIRLSLGSFLIHC
jgi:hypothetical protein